MRVSDSEKVAQEEGLYLVDRIKLSLCIFLQTNDVVIVDGV